MFYAILIGVLTAAVSFLFNFLIENLINIIMFVNNSFSNIYYFPIVGGIILGLINKYVITGNRDFEIIAIEEEISDIDHQFLSYRSVIAKTIASIISLSFGFSLGKQGTIIYVGGAIGSFLGFGLKLPKDDIKTYIGCGVAGMISGVFGLKLLGVVLVGEVIIKKMNLRRIFLTLITVGTTHLVISLFGNDRIFVTSFINGAEAVNFNILYIILFGITAAGVTIMYNRSIIGFSKEILNRWPFITSVINGIIVFLVGSHMNEIYTLHFQSFKELLTTDNTVQFLILFLFVKIIITGISYNFGGYGGVFLPGIMVGAVLGKIFFLTTGYASLDMSIILGISAVFTGFSGGPISGAVLGYELSGYNMEMIFPLIFINYICYFIIKKTNTKFLY